MTPKIITLADGSKFALQSINYERGYYVGFLCDDEGSPREGEERGRGFVAATLAREANAADDISALLELV
jgi:hypothetical protein